MQIFSVWTEFEAKKLCNYDWHWHGFNVEIALDVTNCNLARLIVLEFNIELLLTQDC